MACGSHNEDAGNAENRSLPAIWDDLEDYLEADAAMRDAGDEMGAAAGNGLDALEDAMLTVNKGCKGCHDDYRKDDDD